MDGPGEAMDGKEWMAEEIVENYFILKNSTAHNQSVKGSTIFQT